MDWGPFIQTMIGGGLVLAAGEMTYRRQRRATLQDKRLDVYANALKELDALGRVLTKMAEDRTKLPPSNLELGLPKAFIELDLVASKSVSSLRERLGERILDLVQAIEKSGKQSDAKKFASDIAKELGVIRAEYMEAMRKDSGIHD